MVLANDTDPNSNTLTVTAVGTPMGGSASIGSGGGYVVYAPPGSPGTYTFGNTISDGAGGTASSSVTVYVESLQGRCTTIVLYPQNQRVKGPVAGSLSHIWLPRPILAIVGWRVLTEPSKSFKSAPAEIAGSTAHSGASFRISRLINPGDELRFPFLHRRDPITLRLVRPDMERWCTDRPAAKLRRRRKELWLTQLQMEALFGLSGTAIYECGTERLAMLEFVWTSRDFWPALSA